jgi:hypothetical protein
MVDQDRGRRGSDEARKDQNWKAAATWPLVGQVQLEDDRFIYLLRRNEFAQVALLPSDASPQGVKYELVDRITGEEEYQSTSRAGETRTAPATLPLLDQRIP